MIYLDDLLTADDFNQEVNDLGGGFMARHGLEKVHQLGLVVPDVEQAAEALEQKGIGPFFIAAGSPRFWTEKGENRSVAGKLGLAYHRGVELELLEPVEDSNFYTRSLAPDGRPVVQHLGFLVRETDAWVRKAEKAGMGVWVRGKLIAWPMSADFAYLEPEPESGLIMEFIDWRFLGINTSPFPGFLKMLGRLEKWSGKRCVAL